MDERNIQVDISEAYRYLGGRGTPDESIESELKRAAALIMENIRPRSVTKVCEIERSGALTLKGTQLRLEGKSISALLHDSELCVIFCATIGNNVDDLVRTWLFRDTAFAAMLDACASSAVESFCDSLQGELEDESASQGLYITDRFSPGYGDLPLDVQPEFCSVLDTARKIGVVVGESLLMTPKKSVTAVIGISKNPQKHFTTGCANCERINSCRFRENGVSCYGRTV